MPWKTEGGTGEPTVRVGVATTIPVVPKGLGADPAEVVAEAGFDLKLFDDPDNLISYAGRGHLLAVCVAKTGCPHLGLLVGKAGGLSSLGLVGYLVQHSPDVGSALRTLVRCFRLHAQGAVVTLTEQNGLAFLGYSIYARRVEATVQIADGAMALACNIMRTLCGHSWKPIEVLLAHRKPADLKPFRQLFRAPLRFDAEQNALVFSAEWLSRPMTGADPELRRLLTKQIDALQARHVDDFPEQVRRVLHSAVLTNHAKVDQVAALFSMHSRTLNRRLKAVGTSFQRIADRSRYEIARQMLQDSTLEVSQIAATLGYADASAFTRAFRRWSGTTPTLWRAQGMAGRPAA